jgi:hypothetical protein
MKTDERRRADRLGLVGLSAKYVSNTIEQTVGVHDISTTGALLVCEPGLLVGAELPLRFTFGTGEIAVDARVVRTELIPDSRHVRVAVHFRPNAEIERAVTELQADLEKP